MVIATLRGLGFLDAIERATTAALELPALGGGWRSVFSGAEVDDGAVLSLPIAGRPVEVLVGA